MSYNTCLPKHTHLRCIIKWDIQAEGTLVVWHMRQTVFNKLVSLKKIKIRKGRKWLAIGRRTSEVHSSSDGDSSSAPMRRT